MNTFDVVVVGARLAGAATAMLLARHGLRVALVDRSRLGADTLSTHALMRAGVLQLHRWGLLDRVRDAGTPTVVRTTFTYEDSVVPIDIEPSDGVDGLYAPRRTVLDPILVQAAHEAGVEVRFGYSVKDLVRGPGGRPVGVTGVSNDGSSFTIRAPFVVGADGIRSTIARLVDAPVEIQGQHASAVTYGYWSGAAVDGYEWVFVRDASTGALPTNDGQTCVFASATPERIGRGGVDVITAMLRASAPELAARLEPAQPPSSTRTWHGQTGFLRRAWGSGWALVGDAGYFKDPLSAHGMTDALRDAELLARALVAIHAGADEAHALADYQAQRDEVSVPMFELIDRIASHQWTSAEIGSLLRRQARLMRDEVELVSGLDWPAHAMHSSKGDSYEQLESHAARHAA
ncbi:MAG TPA: NAD(P)/FAD-dependent oxidoreductase [Chloroflexota bacterium]|jgi:2-polyprenyl-6-methoxyphenol hydroxylase-like FAD-dependent oxidoreductase